MSPDLPAASSSSQFHSLRGERSPKASWAMAEPGESAELSARQQNQILGFDLAEKDWTGLTAKESRYWVT